MTTLPVLRGIPLSALCLTASVLLSGCSGGSSGGGLTDNGEPTDSPVGEHPSDGGSSDSPITAPEAVTNFTLTPKATKTLQFSWDDVEGETEYRLLENPDGSAGFEQVATITADSVSYDHVVSLPDRINAQYILQSCNAEGCSDSVTVSVTTSLASAIGYFKASNTGADDDFGVAVSLSGDGNTLVVGAHSEFSSATGVDGDQSDNSATIAGAAYVFTRNGATWTQQAYLKSSNRIEIGRDYFGNALSLSHDGNTLAVAAYNESGDSSVNQSPVTGSNNSGAVYVFKRTGTIWSQQSYIKASNRDGTDLFGIGLSLSADGNTLAVGAVNEDSNATGVNGGQSDNSATNSGAVYLFKRNGDTWNQDAYLKASNAQTFDRFGTDLSLSADGKTLAVGARGKDSESGAVYVFVHSGTAWSEEAYIKASNAEADDQFGSTGGAWTFGTAVSLSGDGHTLAVGAAFESSNATGINGNQDDNSASKSGAVYIFTRSGSDWPQQAYIKASNTDTQDRFGHAVSLSADGNTLAVGALGEDSNAIGINGNQHDKSLAYSGAAFIFKRNQGSWSQQSYLKASNTGEFDWFGGSISLSADGNTLAVGAHHEDGGATGVNGDQTSHASNSGAVYLY